MIKQFLSIVFPQNCHPSESSSLSIAIPQQCHTDWPYLHQREITPCLSYPVNIHGLRPDSHNPSVQASKTLVITLSDGWSGKAQSHSSHLGCCWCPGTYMVLDHLQPSCWCRLIRAFNSTLFLWDQWPISSSGMPTSQSLSNINCLQVQFDTSKRNNTLLLLSSQYPWI